MKLLSVESNLNNRRKSSILKANFKTPTHTTSYFSFSNYFKKKRISLEINKQFSKDLDKGPINKKVNSFKISNTRKKKLFQTGIFGKMSLKRMEKSIRKQIILSSKLIKSEMEPDFGEDILTKTLSNNISNFGKAPTEKAKLLENDKEGLPLKNNNSINSINKNFLQKSSLRNLINSNKNLSKLNTDKSQKNLLSKLSSKNININIQAQINEINYRKLVKTKILYDSFDDSESGNENKKEGYYLSPLSLFIKIFDFLIIISNLFVISFNPYYISKMKYFCYPKPFLFNYIYIFIDILFICDMLLGFWRAFYNRKYQLVTKYRYIIKHYIATEFLYDLIQAFPFFSLIYFLCKQKENRNCTQYNMDTKQMLLIIFSSFKHLKFFKITNKKTNSIIFQLYELTNEKYLAEDILNIFITFLSTFYCFFTLISIHIFIANQNYPNWIESNNLMDKPILLLYLNSFYFITTTMTTVGYGDMIGNSLTETIFRIILLTVGISLYSWIVSNIGSYVDNESRISIRFNRDEAILEEIRISYPNMPYKLYNQILHHLELRKLRQKKLDLNLLINSLPYSLRNTILFAVHKQIITNFKIFKKCQNSDFINQLLTNFIPLFSKKNAILIYENQLVENLVFVKNGRLSLEAAIDIETPIRSINEYFNFKFVDIKENNNKMDSLVHLTPKNAVFNEDNVGGEEELKINDHSALDESIIEKEIGKCEFEGDEFEESNYQFINIINITKNESYGIVYMFLSKPSPLSLRVKSKKAELFLLRKSDAFSIAKRFPNIWKRQYKKSYINMHSIKKRTIKKLTDYCQIYGISFQVIETPELKQNLTIKEILEKAKQKEKIKSSNSISSISNIFKESENKATSNTSPNQNSSNLKNALVSRIPANVKSLNSNENTGTFGMNNNIISFPDKSPKINVIKNKRHSVTSSKLRSEQMSKFKILSVQENSSNNEQPSFGKLVNVDSQKIIKDKKSKDPHNLRKNYIIKLKKKIKKLKASKIYYKTLFKKVSDKLKENKKNNYINLANEIITSLYNYKSESKGKQSRNSGSEKEKENINNNKIITDNDDNKNPKVINNVIVQNNNNYICSISDFISSDSNKSSSSSDRKIEYSIEKNIDFSYIGEYMNLKELTNGEISHNSKFMKVIYNYTLELYLKLMKEKQTKTIIEQIVTNETSNQSLGRKNKKLLKLLSENFLSLSPIISEENKNIKRKRTKKERLESISPIKNNKKLNNLNCGDISKNNLKTTHLNLNNYSVKINLDNSENNNTFLSKGDVTNKSSNNFLCLNKNQNENSKNFGASILSKKLSYKKSFITECEWDKKSNKNDSEINDNTNDRNKLNINENIEKKILATLNSYNSNTEQKLKAKEQKHDFNILNNEINHKNVYKKEKSKKTKEKTVQDYEYCAIL